jgi:hypothetical protein
MAAADAASSQSPTRDGVRYAATLTGAPDDQLIPLTRNEIRRLFTRLGQELAAHWLQVH